MKNLLKFAAASFILTLGWIPGAQAVTINGTDVGSQDDLISDCTLNSSNSGVGTIEDHLLTCLGYAVDLVDDNIDINNGGLLQDGVYNAINVSPQEPGIFVIKYGTGNSTGPDTFVFSNNADLNYLVWTDTELVAAGLPEGKIEAISHYNYGGGGTTDMPEPTTLSLFGLGLLGLGGAMRRRRKVS